MTIQAFGFGSYFTPGLSSGDIDILFVHENLSAESVDVAIKAKRLLMVQQPLCDVVMLSEDEERAQEFIRRSGAVLLRSLEKETLDSDVCDLVRTIGYA